MRILNLFETQNYQFISEKVDPHRNKSIKYRFKAVEKYRLGTNKYELELNIPPFPNPF